MTIEKRRQSVLKKRRFLILLFAFFLMVYVGDSLFAIFENWILIEDSQKNRYYRNERGKLQVTGEYDRNQRPVSVQNVEFYYTQALDFLQKPEWVVKVAAIRSLREILLLPSSAKVDTWKKKAAQAINEYRQQWGDHFTRIEDSVHYLRYEDVEKKEIYLYIPHAFLSLRYPVDWPHIEVRQVKERYTELMIVLIGKRGGKIEQFVIGVDKFIPVTFLSTDQYRKLWHRRLANKKYIREPADSLLADWSAEIYQYRILPWVKPAYHPEFNNEKKTDGYKYTERLLSGKEHYSRKKNYGYYLAWTLPSNFSNDDQKAEALMRMEKIVRSVRVSP